MKCFVLTKRKTILALSVAVCVAAGIVFGIHGAAANAAATKTRLVPIYNVKTDQKKISISQNGYSIFFSFSPFFEINSPYD